MAAEKISWLDVYKTLWKCRDLEISTLWQRSIMLGAFMVATYTGYGALVLNAFENGIAQKWDLFNFLSIALCCFGMLFSALWIMMMKGSKAGFERCESALNAFQKIALDDVFVSEEVRGLSAHGAFWAEKTCEDYTDQSEPSDNLFSTSAGQFSVSRVAIAIGQISFGGWIVLAVCHTVALLLGECMVLMFLRSGLRVVGCALLLGCIALTCGLKSHLRSH